MSPANRRDILKGLGGLGATVVLTACGGSSGSNASGSGLFMGSGSDAANAPFQPTSPGTPATADFDFPTATNLPFAHGVASGDPLADRAIIWTRITQVTPSPSVPVNWFVASDPQLRNLIASGSQTAIGEHDYTIKVDVTGLSAATTYYYAFQALGATSLIGRTRTAPDTMVDDMRIAVVACSSYWSSFWSGYSHLARRNDIDLVLHCGDYIYDFVDEDEEVRARNNNRDINHPDYRDWLNLDECRRRYALFRSDPNLARAHQQHPWSIVWDNHDISVGFGNELDDASVDDSGATTTLNDVVRAFFEWTPTRPPRADGSGEFFLVEDGSYPVPPDPLLIYRRLDYGPMLDIFNVDTQLFLRDDQQADANHLDSGDSLFSRPQYDFLTSGMLASQQRGTRWRLVNNQTWIAPVGAPVPIPIELSRWSGFTEERAALFQFLRGNNPAGERVRGNIIVSGDLHGNWGSDLIEDNGLATAYLSGPALPNARGGSTVLNTPAGIGRASTGNSPLLNAREMSVGVEFAPSSMGRGGADEIIANANPASTLLDQILGTRAIEAAVINGNKNCQFIEWVDHGYGIVHLTEESAIFEFWWQDKLTPDAPDVLGYQMISFAEDDAGALPTPRYRDQLDNLELHGMPVAETRGTRVSEPAPEGELSPR